MALDSLESKFSSVWARFFLFLWCVLCHVHSSMPFTQG